LGGSINAAMKRQRRTLGAIVQIALGDGRNCYAQTLEEPEFVFFDLCTPTAPDLNSIIVTPILFRVWVMSHAVTSGKWPKLGVAAIREDLARPVPRFIQDALNPSRFEITLGGKSRPATPEECEVLERAAVWDPEHVEDRLRDHYAGRPNKWVESLRLRNLEP
jgi:hypothetical protein